MTKTENDHKARGSAAQSWNTVLKLVILALLVFVGAYLLQGNLDTTEMIHKHTGPLMRHLMLSGIQSVIPEYVAKHHELPRSLADFTGIRRNYLVDPLANENLLGYKYFDSNHAYIYSVGFDKVDDGGLKIYNPRYDDMLWLLVADRHPNNPEREDFDRDLLSGDLVVAMTVLESSAGERPSLSLTWLEPGIPCDDTPIPVTSD